MTGLIKKVLGFLTWSIVTWLLGIVALVVLGIWVSIFAWNKFVPSSSSQTTAKPASQTISNNVKPLDSSKLLALQKEHEVFVRQKEIMMARHLELAIAYKKKYRHRNDILRDIKLLTEKKHNLQKEKLIKFPVLIGGIRCQNETEYKLLLGRLDRLIEASKMVVIEYDKDLELISRSLEKLEPATAAINKQISEIKRTILSSQVYDEIEAAYLLLPQTSKSMDNSFDIHRIEQELKQHQKR